MPVLTDYAWKVFLSWWIVVPLVVASVITQNRPPMIT